MIFSRWFFQSYRQWNVGKFSKSLCATWHNWEWMSFIMIIVIYNVQIKIICVAFLSKEPFIFKIKINNFSWKSLRCRLCVTLVLRQWWLITGEKKWIQLNSLEWTFLFSKYFFFVLQIKILITEPFGCAYRNCAVTLEQRHLSPLHFSICIYSLP